jgi:hypothetical protein
MCRALLVCVAWLLAAPSWAELNDPTRPLNVAVSNVETTHLGGLEAIIRQGTNRYAIFNGATIRVGDHLGNFQVLEIHSNTVQLRGPGGKMTLFLFDQDFKRVR